MNRNWNALSAGQLTRRQTGVPGVSRAALDAIADANTRMVLQQIMDGLDVRNGLSGAGGKAFVTREELRNSVERVELRLDDSVRELRHGGFWGDDGSIQPGQVAAIMNELMAQVMNTKLWKDLGARVDLIDKPDGLLDKLGELNTAIINEANERATTDIAIVDQLQAAIGRIGDSEAAIANEANLRINADNALAETINTQFSGLSDSLALVQNSVTTVANAQAATATQVNQMQVTQGEQAAAIVEERNARVAADGTLYAQYYIKLDVNGRVAGYGLANDGKTSDFIVRADTFAVGSPQVNGGKQTVPFIVRTTETTVNGQKVPPGVYMDSAFIVNGTIDAAKIGFAQIKTAHIEDAQITNAKIQDLAVDTLKIGKNAVTIPAAYEFDLTATESTSFAYVTINVPIKAGTRIPNMPFLVTLGVHGPEFINAQRCFDIFLNNISGYRKTLFAPVTYVSDNTDQSNLWWINMLSNDSMTYRGKFYFLQGIFYADVSDTMNSFTFGASLYRSGKNYGQRNNGGTSHKLRGTLSVLGLAR